MIEIHLPPQDLALYVLGALAPEQIERVEQHVAVCAECADALTKEAQLEVKLQALVPAALAELPPAHAAIQPYPLHPTSPQRPARWPAMAMVAAALALVTGLSLPRRPPAPPSAAQDVAPSYLSARLPSAPASEWPRETGSLQCTLLASGLSCTSPIQESAREVGEDTTSIIAACYAPR